MKDKKKKPLYLTSDYNSEEEIEQDYKTTLNQLKKKKRNRIGIGILAMAVGYLGFTFGDDIIIKRYEQKPEFVQYTELKEDFSEKNDSLSYYVQLDKYVQKGEKKFGEVEFPESLEKRILEKKQEHKDIVLEAKDNLETIRETPTIKKYINSMNTSNILGAITIVASLVYTLVNQSKYDLRKLRLSFAKDDAYFRLGKKQVIKDLEK